MTDIERLLKGRELIESYREKKLESSLSPEERLIVIEGVKKDLQELGFETPSHFYKFDNRLSLLEIARCFVPIHVDTGEENPLCDLCEGRGEPGCMLDPITHEHNEMRFECASRRLRGEISRSFFDDVISQEEDLIFKAQKERANKEQRYDLMLMSVTDIVHFWPNETHTSFKCNVKLSMKEEPRFDFMWNLRRYTFLGR